MASLTELIVIALSPPTQLYVQILFIPLILSPFLKQVPTAALSLFMSQANKLISFSNSKKMKGKILKIYVKIMYFIKLTYRKKVLDTINLIFSDFIKPSLHTFSSFSLRHIFSSSSQHKRPQYLPSNFLLVLNIS